MVREAARQTPKQEAQDLLQKLPEDASWEQLAYALEVRADIEAGLRDVEAGRVTSVEALRHELGLPE